MGLTKPYFRVVRPYKSQNTPGYSYDGVDKYISDPRYAQDRQELLRASKLIEKDLLRLFDYIEPTDDHLDFYSHRTYELLLRTATEFETNCKRILESNGYPITGNLNVKDDYFKINKSSRLADYTASLLIWYPSRKKEFKPFEKWTGNYKPLPWYKSYNAVKHDRYLNFKKATLESVLSAIAGLRVILFSQFCACATLPGDFMFVDDQSAFHVSGDIFEVTPPTTWAAQELYDFNWDNIKGSSSPFAQFPF